MGFTKMSESTELSDGDGLRARGMRPDSESAVALIMKITNPHFENSNPPNMRNITMSDRRRTDAKGLLSYFQNLPENQLYFYMEVLSFANQENDDIFNTETMIDLSSHSSMVKSAATNWWKYGMYGAGGEDNLTLTKSQFYDLTKKLLSSDKKLEYEVFFEYLDVTAKDSPDSFRRVARNLIGYRNN